MRQLQQSEQNTRLWFAEDGASIVPVSSRPSSYPHSLAPTPGCPAMATSQASKKTMTQRFCFQKKQLRVLAGHVSTKTAGMASFGSGANLHCAQSCTGSQRGALGRISRNSAVPCVMRGLIWSLVSRLPKQMLFPH